jgi:hypothetical protein
MFTLIIAIIFTYTGVFFALLNTLDIQSIGSGIGLYSDLLLSFTYSLTRIGWKKHKLKQIGQ